MPSHQVERRLSLTFPIAAGLGGWVTIHGFLLPLEYCAMEHRWPLLWTGAVNASNQLISTTVPRVIRAPVLIVLTAPLLMEFAIQMDAHLASDLIKRKPCPRLAVRPTMTTSILFSCTALHVKVWKVRFENNARSLVTHRLQNVRWTIAAIAPHPWLDARNALLDISCGRLQPMQPSYAPPIAHLLEHTLRILLLCNAKVRSRVCVVVYQHVIISIQSLTSLI